MNAFATVMASKRDIRGVMKGQEYILDHYINTSATSIFPSDSLLQSLQMQCKRHRHSNSREMLRLLTVHKY